MRRRSFVGGALGSAGLAGITGLAGCNGLFDARVRNPAGTSTGTGPGTSTSTPTPESDLPYSAPGAPSLDRPRGVRVRNLTAASQFVTVVVADGDEEVFVGNREVGSGASVRFGDLVASGGGYRVLVETAGGDQRRVDWEPTDAYGDLWVELRSGTTSGSGSGSGSRSGSTIAARRLAVCTPDCEPLSVGGRTEQPYEPPRDRTAVEALDRLPAIALDNDAGRRRRATVRVWRRDGLLLEYDYDLPAEVRAIVPIVPSQPRYNVRVRTDDGEVSREWLPGVRTPLYATLRGEPRFRCGFVPHDLRVINESERARDVAVRVRTSDDGTGTLFERSFALGSLESRTVRGAVDAGGLFRFRVETGDGVVERTQWNFCAPDGTINVQVSDRGVFVSVQSSVASL